MEYRIALKEGKKYLYLSYVDYEVYNLSEKREYAIVFDEHSQAVELITMLRRRHIGNFTIPVKARHPLQFGVLNSDHRFEYDSSTRFSHGYYEEHEK